MHKRFFPKENAFSYGVYYLALPLPTPPIRGFFNSFYPKDLGARDGSDPSIWLRQILKDYGLNEKIKDIVLVTMPRVMGYVFNPVSFYLCLDEHQELRAVLCEVHNTFGEQHSYLCALPDHRVITGEDWLRADKVFHVSPFLERHGEYTFRFDLRDDKMGIWIDFYDHDKKKQLITSLIGNFSPLDSQSLRKAFWRHPLVTLKTISLIHWQAFMLIIKGIRIITKPLQKQEKITTTDNITRNMNKM